MKMKFWVKVGSIETHEPLWIRPWFKLPILHNTVQIYTKIYFRIQSMSLGQGQGPKAEKMVEAAMVSGDWVFLEVKFYLEYAEFRNNSYR